MHMKMYRKLLGWIAAKKEKRAREYAYVFVVKGHGIKARRHIGLTCSQKKKSFAKDFS